MVKALAKRTLRADHLRFLSWSRNRFGLIPAMVGFAGMLRHQGIAKARNSTTGMTVAVRPGTVDQVVYDEVFVKQEFDVPLASPRVIVDAGAHIGLASIYFASRFPNATIIAIEPEPDNFRLLRENAAGWPNIHPVHAALWRGPGRIGIDNAGAESWGVRVSGEAEKRDIPALGVPEVMRLFRLEEIDVLKLDIEGSEIEVFENSAEWLPTVKNLIVELHDRFRPGCTEALEGALKGFDHQRWSSGEKTMVTEILKRPDRIPSNAVIPWVNCRQIETAVA